MENITVEALVRAPVEKAWEYWTDPKHVSAWNHASDDWESPEGKNDLRVGGSFLFRMVAKDRSAGFDFTGTYTEVVPQEKITYRMDDGRQVSVVFAAAPEGTRVTETFEAESENPIDAQRAGWQAILDNFRKHAEESWSAKI